MPSTKGSSWLSLSSRSFIISLYFSAALSKATALSLVPVDLLICGPPYKVAKVRWYAHANVLLPLLFMESVRERRFMLGRKHS